MELIKKNMLEGYDDREDCCRKNNFKADEE